MKTFTELLEKLSGQLSKDELQKLGVVPSLFDHELVAALYTLQCKKFDLFHKKYDFTPLESGAIPLFRKGYYPWGALPYLKEHADLYHALVKLGRTDLTQKMREWILKTLDHTHKPLFSFFRQEGQGSYDELLNSYRTFFEGEKEKGLFYDAACAFARLLTNDTTIFAFGTGCKSGMGAFLYEDVGVINFGPQTLPIDNCDAFGLAGKAKNQKYSSQEAGFSFSFQTPLAAKSTRIPPFPHLKDSGFSKLWLDSQIVVTEETMEIDCEFTGFKPIDTLAFLFFAKGEGCFVSGSQKLRLSSLDRYVGPSNPIEFRSKRGKISLFGKGGIAKMEVVPLAGGDSFWGSDYLVAYFLNAPSCSFSLEKNRI